MSPEERLLQRAAEVIRLPGSASEAPRVADRGTGLRCPLTGRVFPYRNGILELLAADTPRTIGQLALDTAVTVWLYDRLRDSLLRVFGLPNFQQEVADAQARLHLAPGDVVLDLACGHANFTVEWARLVGPTGFVIGLDLSASMLARAAVRVRAAPAGSVLLVHGDALHLPLADRSVLKVNCSGGFHAFPDLPRALREIARVSVPGAPLTASMFAEDPSQQHPRVREWLREKVGLHFVPLLWLGEQLAAADFVDYRWSVPRRGFGYISATRARPRSEAA